MRRLPKMRRRVSNLKSATARQFSGGLNVVDSELNLSSKYARVLDNMYRGLDGAQQIRQGTELFADLNSISDGFLLNGTYFANHIIAVNDVGQVFAIDGTGASTRIWDLAIAAGTRPGLVTWGETAYVAFEEFGGDLTVHNGQDKPLTINTSLNVDYLADLATGSNINVPIGSIVCKFNKHLVVAIGSDIYVSDENAAGTWTGDAGATYANVFSMRTSVTSGPTDIVGLTPFRDWLLVRFRECTVPIQFKKTTTPDALEINDTSDIGGGLDTYGSISHRTSQNIGEATLACDISGVSSIALATFTAKLSPDRPSRLIDPLIRKAIAPISNATLQYGAFATYQRTASMYSLFIPDGPSVVQAKVRGFGFRYIDKLNIKAWNTFSGWNWAWGAQSSEGLMFYGRVNDNKIFLLGDVEQHPIYADYKNEQETFSDNTPFSDNTGLLPVADEDRSGVPINWKWDIPWSDLKRREITKTTKYLILDTEGTADFTVKFFIDDKYEDGSDPGEPFTDGILFSDGTGFIREQVELTPAISLDLVGSERGGYGKEAYNDNYGGGRNTKFRRLISCPTKFTTFKMRFEGSSMRPLKIIGITPMYAEGTIRRNSDI